MFFSQFLGFISIWAVKKKPHNQTITDNLSGALILNVSF